MRKKSIKDDFPVSRDFLSQQDKQRLVRAINKAHQELLVHPEGKTGFKSFFPPDEFEQKTGLKGISQKYALPQILPSYLIEEFSCYYRHLLFDIRDGEVDDNSDVHIDARIEDYREDVKKLWLWIKELNPELDNLDFDTANFKALEAAIFGATSRYNIDDIQHYLDGPYGGRETPWPESYFAKERETAKFFKYGLYGQGIWMSEKTLDKITAQLSGRKTPIIAPPELAPYTTIGPNGKLL